MSASPRSTPTAGRSALPCKDRARRSWPKDAWCGCSATFAHPRGTWLDPSTGKRLHNCPAARPGAAKGRAARRNAHRSMKSIAGSSPSQPCCMHCIRTSRSASRCFRARCRTCWTIGSPASSRRAAFLQAVDWPTVWGYDANLYLPLFHFCRQQRVKMLALNCHRPLVTRVGKEGWAAIPESERDGLTPAADATPAYRQAPVRHHGRNGGAHAGEVGRRSDARSFHPRAADLGSRVRLQHRPRAGAAKSPAGCRHHRLGPSAATVTARHISCAISASRTSRCCCRHSMPSTMRRRSKASPTPIFRLDDVEPQAPLPPRMQAAVDATRAALSKKPPSRSENQRAKVKNCKSKNFSN